MKQLWKSVTDDEIETLLLIVTGKSIETNDQIESCKKIETLSVESIKIND